jgi:hypothetical protein
MPEVRRVSSCYAGLIKKLACLPPTLCPLELATMYSDFITIAGYIYLYISLVGPAPDRETVGPCIKSRHGKDGLLH